MPITDKQLKDCIHQAGFPAEVRPQVEALIKQGLENFREHKTRSYYGVSGRLIKKPTRSHNAPMGRHDQEDVRTVLISALCRAWMVGFGTKPTLNNKNNTDSPFFNFALAVLTREGLGHIYAHLEEYWSCRKRTWEKNDLEWRLSGGSEEGL
jgi:hypothetical protein